MSGEEPFAAGRAEVLAAFRKYDALVDAETDTIEWRHFCCVLGLLDPVYYTDAVLTALGKQVAPGEAPRPSERFGLEALIGHIFGLGEAAAEPEVSHEKVAVLHVRKFTGDVLLSLHREEAESLTAVKLKVQAAKKMGRRAPEVSLIMGTRKLADAELIDELLPSEGVLELLVAAQQLPQFDPEQPSIDQLDALSWMLLSPDDDDKMAACRRFRQLLADEQAPPIDRVIELGLVPRLVELCREWENPTLQFEAAWALTNVASGTEEQTRVVVESGGVATFVELLRSPNTDVGEQAVWGLGNIAGDSAAMRDRVLRHGALQPVVDMWFANDGLSFKRNATWTVSNFCRGKPLPRLAEVLPAMRMLAQSICSEDEEVITDSAWAFSYIADGPNERIQAVLDCGVLPRLVELLQHPAVSVVTAALRAVGCIVTGDDAQTEHVLVCGALPAFRDLLGHHKRGIRKEACWTISNITAGTREQIQAVIDAGLIRPVALLLQGDTYDVRKEAVWALKNAATGGSLEQLSFFAHEDGCATGLVQAAGLADNRLVLCALEAIQRILEAGRKEQQDRRLPANPLAGPFLGAGVEGVEQAMQAEMLRDEKLLDLVNTIHALLGEASDLEDSGLAVEPENAQGEEPPDASAELGEPEEPGEPQELQKPQKRRN